LVLSLRKPTREEIRKFLDKQSRLDFSYSFVGQTASTPPANFSVDHTRIRLGSGEAVFIAAIQAIQRWEQFGLGWVEAWPPETPIKSGEVVGVMGYVMGVWWLNACRIVYVIDEGGPVQRFGFAYGTLPGHVESGEERFLIEWDRDENSVWYDILAFSRPRHLLARLGYPFARLMQKRFARDSAKAMLRLVGVDSRR
jgi:uncharacterized protein (UPF0548 family)